MVGRTVTKREIRAKTSKTFLQNDEMKAQRTNYCETFLSGKTVTFISNADEQMRKTERQTPLYKPSQAYQSLK